MSSQETESEDQSEPAETAQSITYNETNPEETQSFTSNEEIEETEEVIETGEYSTDVTEVCGEETEEESMEPAEMKQSPSPFELVSTIYTNPYYWAIFKSTVLFLLALKMARECKMLRIPMREYKPFNRYNF